nr:hypothetical protein B0A51_17499 [Rachicladosporium sp. CCFEE 5018]
MAESGARRAQASGYRLIAVEVALRGLDGTKLVRGLVDCGSAGNFVSQTAALEVGLKATEPAETQYAALNGQSLRVTGQGDVPLAVTDSHGRTIGGKAKFNFGRIHGYDVILGMPWLEQWNPSVDFSTKKLAWRRKGRPARRRIAMATPHEVEEAIRNQFATAYSVVVQVVASLAQTGPGELPSQYSGHAGAFSTEGSASLPESGPQDLSIDLVEGSTSPWMPLYNLSQDELVILKEYIQTNLAKGWIRHSKSPAEAPILFVKKKDGTMRLCVDYRGLNNVTVKNRHPLPLIPESLDQLAWGRIFTKLDVRDAYHRIRIKPGDEWKTAFRTRYGHFEYTVMPFGLANAPVAFQGYINSALSDLLDVCCVVYLDDILVFSKTEADHVRHVRSVLERLETHGLYAKLSKCEFHKDQVDFLGFVVGQNGVQMDPDRVRSVQEWPVPRCIRDIRVFIGFANYYRRFVHRFSRIAAPLNAYTEGAKAGTQHSEAR